MRFAAFIGILGIANVLFIGGIAIYALAKQAFGF